MFVPISMFQSAAPARGGKGTSVGLVGPHHTVEAARPSRTARPRPRWQTRPRPVILDPPRSADDTPRTFGGVFRRGSGAAKAGAAPESGNASMPSYHPQRIEPKWQAYWERNKTFRAGDLFPGQPKLYILDMFPYPSGAGLHVGHPEGYTATDILCRYRRMRGDNVLHPMGWDAFGLPAEQYAVKTNTHPRITTRANVDTFRRPIK